MGKRVGIWVLGLIGSLAAHVVILGVMLIAIQPDPVTEQPLPTSELDVQAYQLDRTQAREQQPESQKTDTDTPDGQSLDAGAIPQSRAVSAQPRAQVLNPDTTPPPAAAEIRQQADLVELADPTRTEIPQVDAKAASARQVDPAAASLAQASPDTVKLDALEQTRPRIQATRAEATVISSAVTPTIPVAASVARTEYTVPVARPAVATLAAFAPQAAVVPTSLPAIATTSAAALNSAALPEALPDIASARPVSAQATALVTARPAVAAAQALAPDAPSLVAALPAVETMQPTAAPASTIAVAAPQLASLPQATAKTSTVAPSTPTSTAALSQKTDAAQIRPAAPSAQKLKAALAFSGGDGNVDPVSIAAFQSFMQPGDIAASGDQLRDGVAGLLAQVPCSRMQVVFNPETATLNVNGHIPDEDLRAPVLAALRAQMGADITVSDNILILPRPQCGALSGIANVGLPQSTDQITNPLVIGEDAQARVFSFATGDLLSLDMTGPDYDAYIYLDYFDANGTVLHLEPNEYAPLRRVTAKAVHQIGARTMEDAEDVGLKLVIGPPYGQEIAVAFAASESLYDGLRPIQEPAAEYLEWLKSRVEIKRAQYADFKGEWVYFFVSTVER